MLIVEDNAETRDVLKLILNSEGYSIAAAANGQQAIDYLRAGNPVSLIILDMRMPIMDGWQVSREMRADPKLADIPVIAFSAVVEGDVPGAVATIRKATVDPTIFLRLIEHVARDRDRLT